MYGTFNLAVNIAAQKQADEILARQDQRSSTGSTYPFTVQRMGNVRRVFNAETG